MLLFLAASIVYAISGDWRRFFYYLLAAGITASVTF
jgi:hypothetical protein